jgi:hypothetical protein
MDAYMHTNHLTEPILLTVFLGLCVGARYADAQVCERFERLSAEECQACSTDPTGAMPNASPSY